MGFESSNKKKKKKKKKKIIAYCTAWILEAALSRALAIRLWTYASSIYISGILPRTLGHRGLRLERDIKVG